MSENMPFTVGPAQHSSSSDHLVDLGELFAGKFPLIVVVMSRTWRLSHAEEGNRNMQMGHPMLVLMHVYCP